MCLITFHLIQTFIHMNLDLGRQLSNTVDNKFHCFQRSFHLVVSCLLFMGYESSVKFLSTKLRFFCARG